MQVHLPFMEEVKLPYSENDNVDKPINIYAATKKSNELMAHSYSHLYNLPTTGLRFLQFMVLKGLTWLYINLLKQFIKTRR